MGIARRSTRSGILGESLTALCGGALALNLVLVAFLLGLLAVHGGGYFWQKKLVRLELDDGSVLLGEIHQTEFSPRSSDPLRRERRMQIKVGNRDLTGADFRWVDERRVVGRSYPENAAVVERTEWGNFYGTVVELRRGSEALAKAPNELWATLGRLLEETHREGRSIRRLEKREIGDVNFDLERLRLARRHVERLPPEKRGRALEENARSTAETQTEYEVLAQRLERLREKLLAETVVLEAADGTRKEIPVGSVVRAIRPNTMGWASTLGLYGARLWEFVSGDPRESNTEGGIFPAIFGTVLMVFLMSFAVVPLGVLSALYLREYARQGPIVRVVRIAVNNLAGVPSIVFGIFGLGFFVYFIGGTIDRLFYQDALPTPTYGTGGILWASLTLALLTVPVVIVATEEGLAAVPRIVREGSLALGATRFETTWKVVVPAAAPGILTGLILAMARAAGEVAPLMIVGMVKLAPSLPLDHHFPFAHPERKFMHLGFHIYDVGFQSPNVEATKPLVFATALLLIAVVTGMNLVAISVRNRLRKKYASSSV